MLLSQGHQGLLMSHTVGSISSVLSPPNLMVVTGSHLLLFILHVGNPDVTHSKVCEKSVLTLFLGGCLASLEEAQMANVFFKCIFLFSLCFPLRLSLFSFILEFLAVF